MAVVKNFGDGYGTPKRPMKTKRIPPLIVPSVRNGTVFYFVMFGVFIQVDG
ncbi:hypothetical protein EDC04DRAFT_2891709 [Pisolithus marmoratus]|nr:hypothetical protein EDC04DRAFT_2891709 [Pisolithus marmoratus]